MKDENLEITEILAHSSRNRATVIGEESEKALIVRGITKKKSMETCKQQGRDFYYVDTGYFGNFRSVGNPGGKKMWHRIVKNDVQHCNIIPRPPTRWNELVRQDPRLKWKGWKKTGNKILLVMPNPKACNYYDFDKDVWLKETIQQIKKHTDKPIVVREKGSRSYRIVDRTIYDEFDSGIFATVCFNSIAAVESVAYGIPAFVQVPCAASPVADHDLSKLENPTYHDSDKIHQWEWSLAYGQFTTYEFQNGLAWQISNL